ncbi:MAG: guanylate kinase [Phycisphaeraceae bacterium]
MPRESKPDPQPGTLVIVSGPSGVGKSTIVNAMVDRLDAVLSVSMTTRPMGPNDIDGEHYVFVNEREFKDMVKLGQMLEYAQVYDNYYGTPVEPVEAALADDRVVILEIDVQGAHAVKQRMPRAIGILIEPPSDDVLLDRLRARKREDEATIQKRFSRARDEIQLARDLGIYKHTIVNDRLDDAIDRAVALVEGEVATRHGGR